MSIPSPTPNGADAAVIAALREAFSGFRDDITRRLGDIERRIDDAARASVHPAAYEERSRGVDRRLDALTAALVEETAARKSEAREREQRDERDRAARRWWIGLIFASLGLSAVDILRPLVGG